MGSEAIELYSTSSKSNTGNEGLMSREKREQFSSQEKESNEWNVLLNSTLFCGKVRLIVAEDTMLQRTSFVNVLLLAFFWLFVLKRDQNLLRTLENMLHIQLPASTATAIAILGILTSCARQGEHCEPTNH